MTWPKGLPTGSGLDRSLWFFPRQRQSAVSELVTAGLDTIAVRMPVGIARDIVAELGRPLAAPSANPSGRLSATTAAAVEAGLGEKVSLIVDGGASRIGVESTIVKVTDGRIILLRPGGIPVEDIQAATGGSSRGRRCGD